MREGHRIVLVEFMGRKPFSVVTMDAAGHFDHYDFAWCQRDGTMLYDVSSHSLYLEHGNSTYWAADEVIAELHSGGGEKPTGKRLRKMPKAFPLERLFDGEEIEFIYCSKCKDFLPWDDGGELCEHVHWCEECGWWSGPGYETSCKHQTAEA